MCTHIHINMILSPCTRASSAMRIPWRSWLPWSLFPVYMYLSLSLYVYIYIYIYVYLYMLIVVSCFYFMSTSF